MHTYVCTRNNAVFVSEAIGVNFKWMTSRFHGSIQNLRIFNKEIAASESRNFPHKNFQDPEQLMQLMSNSELLFILSKS